MSVDKDVLERAKEWSELDPNETTSAYVKDLLKRVSSENGVGSKAVEELNALFPKKRIEFGTAGLRSTMKPGPVGMNDLVVVQAAQGIATYVLQENSMENGQKICAVIGFDHRRNSSLDLSSLSFALLSALVFKEAGMEVILLDYPENEGFVGTPMVPFTLSRTENAKLGIMITASHNPKQDAGYKVYWRNGCQIRPPVDKGMADSILQNLKPWVDYGALLKTRKEKYSDPCLGLSNAILTKKMVDKYFEAIKSSLVTGQAELLKEEGWEQPKMAYTAMHGIGHTFAVKSYETFGFTPFRAVPSQMKIDPDFPTVPFPNPEEKGALDDAKKFCEDNGLDVILANDPDADRLAVAEKDRQTGAWTVFTGDQIGTMLGCWLYEKVGKPSGKVSRRIGKQQYSSPGILFCPHSIVSLVTTYHFKPVSMCASTVSSKMLAEVAKVEGFHFEDTLTGFKWIGSRAEELSREGKLALFGYEEAIGFCCGDVVFDKDGISKYKYWQPFNGRGDKCFGLTLHYLPTTTTTRCPGRLYRVDILCIFQRHGSQPTFTKLV